ncbi:MAG: glycerol-3-phosphate acyltransferase, partial [Pseudomonadota bacterium]
LADILGDHGLITRYDEGPDVVYTIVPEQHHEASYYRNTTIHHFIVKAIAEMALMKAIEAPDNRANILRQEAAYLRDLFKFEFFYAPRLAFDASVDAELRRYEPDWETRINASESDAQQLLQRFHPHVASAALLPFVESYRIVASILARLPGDEGIDAKSCLSQALAFGKQAYLQRRITTEASVGKLLFENAYQQFDHQHLITPRDGSLRQARTEALAQIADLANRLERIKLQMTPTDRW